MAVLPRNLANRVWLARHSRRTVLQAGSLGLLGLGMADLSAVRALANPARTTPAKSVIFVFLNGGISHQDSFDMKPEAPLEVRGEFRPIPTRTPGLEICEHMPLLAQQSERYAVVRSIASGSSGHEEACHMLFTGRLDFPAGFSLARVPSPNEWPSLASQVTYLTRGRNSLPPAAVLPQPSVNEANAFRPGQYAGKLGARHEAWHLHVAAACALGNGACPNCFRFEGTPFEHESKTIFDMPVLTLPDGGRPRLDNRLGLLAQIEDQQRRLEQGAEQANLDRNRQQAISVLADPRVQSAFDVEQAEPATLARYGKNKFGLSLLMARRLVEAGCPFVTMVWENPFPSKPIPAGCTYNWDSHAVNCHIFEDSRWRFPVYDQAVSALIEDLHARGLDKKVLLGVTGEFGRTPRLEQKVGTQTAVTQPGRDHWPQAMSLIVSGGGMRTGQIIGATNARGEHPVERILSPNDLWATVYHHLDIDYNASLNDFSGRPQPILPFGQPIDELLPPA